jgi:hypothetical protein
MVLAYDLGQPLRPQPVGQRLSARGVAGAGGARRRIVVEQTHESSTGDKAFNRDVLSAGAKPLRHI